ncbi:MAG: right-handed parallel beta-helix repeat-containing protein, partial [Planctomycetota bacterium]
MKKTILLNLVLLLVTVESAPAETRMVPGEYATIQAAIDDCADGDIVIIAPGIYTGEGNRDINYGGKAITVRSTDPQDPDVVTATVIDCDGTEEEPHRGFKFEHGEGPDSIIAGLTIRNGYSDRNPEFGGGIRCHYSSPTISHCRLENNASASVGGGIGCTFSSPTIRYCIINNNSAGSGGGLYCNQGDATLICCTFSGNSAKTGGGIYHFHGSIVLDNCTISGNNCDRRGGGIKVNMLDLFKLNNCLINNNYTSAWGGGINCENVEKVLIRNCTISDNAIDEWRGGGINFYGLNTGSNITLSNCVLWGNRAPSGPQIDVFHYSDLFVSYSDVQGGLNDVSQSGSIVKWDKTNIDFDPCFVSPGFWDTNGVWIEGDYHLLPDSPCIDSGDPYYVPSPGETDIDGEPRVIGGRVDMGADEFPSTVTTILRVSPTEFQFSSFENGPNPKEQIMSIRNTGSGTLNWEIFENYQWFEVYPTKGTSIGDVNEVNVIVDITGLKPGKYNAEFWITSNGNVNTPLMVPVSLDVYGRNELHVPSEFSTIQEAIDCALDRAIVIVEKGIYTGYGNRDIDFHGKAITVRSIDPNDPNIVEATVINCEGRARGFNFHSGEDANSILDGFTITNGYARYGGGIYCENSSPTITNCTFRDNTAKFCSTCSTLIPNENSSSMVSNDSVVHTPPGPGPFYRGKGGGFYCTSSNPTLKNCKFIDNSAYIYGGGMCNIDNSSPTLTNCTFSSNSALYGGALSNYTANPSLFNCIFNGNSAEFDGGGIDNYDNSKPILTNCTFSSNWASYGGAMNNLIATSSLFNCTFSGNRASISGGGIYSQQGYPPPTPPPSPPPLGIFALTIENGISAENAYNDIYHGSASYNMIIANCILWDNEAPTGPQIYLTSDRYSWVKYNDVQGGWPGEGNIDAEPLFVLPGYWDANGLWIEGDYHLLPGSPCIDAGDPNYAAEPNETDLDGGPRVMGGRIDMGAYEFTSIQAEARIIPRTINLASRGNWITCYIWLPEQYNVADIDTNSVVLEQHIKSEQLSVDEQNQVAIARFSREEVQSIVDVGEVELTIYAKLTDGTVFEALDVIRVIDEDGGKPDKLQAGVPNPPDGAIDISTTADLSWTAGSFAQSHDVYFGTSINPPFVCNQIDTTFDPATMDFDTTYFWRIDEHNKWGETAGVLWSFTTGPSPGQASNPNPTDGETWVSTNADLSWKAGSYATSHDVYFGTSSTPPFIANQTYTTFEPGRMNPGTTYYWRIDEVNKWGKTTGLVWSFTTIEGPLPPPPPNEFRASDPNPHDWAILVSIIADLSWKAGSDATSHDVYFGTGNPPPFVRNQTATTYDPGLMDYSTTYYWRIDEVNDSGTTTGEIWKFTTLMAPPPPP